MTSGEAKEYYKSDKTKGVTYINNTQYMPTSTGFSLFSDNRELYHLQDLILLFANTLDQHLIVCNQTYNLPINTCATRYVANHNGKLCEVISVAKFKPPKKHTPKTDKVIDAIRENVKRDAFKKLKSKVDWVNNAMFRW
jgi:hypothetical protein